MSFVRASSRPRAPRAAMGGEPRERRPGRPRGHLLRMVSALGVYSFALADTAPVLRRRDTAVYCHAVATSPAYRSRAGSSGSLQAGSRLVARVRPRPDPATPFWACEVPFSPSLEASDVPLFRKRRVRARRCVPVQFTQELGRDGSCDSLGRTSLRISTDASSRPSRPRHALLYRTRFPMTRKAFL